MDLLIHEDVRPSRTALINVDVQNCFVDVGPLAPEDGPEVVERINTISAACRAAGMLVVHTRTVFRADSSNAMRLIRPEAAALCLEGSPTAELHPDLHVEPADVRLDKPRFDAFHGTDLDLLLAHRGIETIVVTGFETNICCESTARAAASRDYQILFVEDGTSTVAMGGVSADDLKRATCAVLGYTSARIVTTAEVVGMLTAPSASALAS